ncbi:hypothetical protein [Promicromonospora iranensis]|uniref:Uncharacterized protein n=1 Tax=Promicromonospora iranensis TaxID=1105144 RepID=A0ABU2CVS0_9MICO|nr:hypothetical protein [Promicromonospora iranensis]MDR7385232.1 hypothetical protein [Promicromonospora iranensis]
MTFTARYPGRCASCHCQIVPGDEVGYTQDDELVHADCYEPDTEPEPGPPPTCPTCWLTPPCEHTEEP